MTETDTCESLLAKLTTALAPLMDPEKCSAFTSAWELDPYDHSLDGEAIWHELKAIYDAATQRDPGRR